MDYFQALLDRIYTSVSYVKTILLNLLVPMLIFYALTITLRFFNSETEEREEHLTAKSAKRLAQEVELEQLSQKLAEKRDEEEQLQFEHQKLSRRIARTREDQEELKHEQKRLSQKIGTMTVFQGQSWEERLKEAARKVEEEELKRNKEILARGNEIRMALEEQRRTALENERIAAKEGSRKGMEAEYKWDESDWEGSGFEPSDTEQDLELGFDSVTGV